MTEYIRRDSFDEDFPIKVTAIYVEHRFGVGPSLSRGNY